MYPPARALHRTAAACLAALATSAQAQPDARVRPRTQHAAATPAAPVDTATPRDSVATHPAALAPALLPGAGAIRTKGLLQAWYLTSTATARSTFRLRRAELRLTGDLGARIGWALGVDAARALAMTPTYVTVSRQRVVADESVNLARQILPDAMVTVRAPLGFVGTHGDARLETVERPMSAADGADAALQLDYAVRSFHDHVAPTRGRLLPNLQTSR